MKTIEILEIVPNPFAFCQLNMFHSIQKYIRKHPINQLNKNKKIYGEDWSICIVILHWNSTEKSKIIYLIYLRIKGTGIQKKIPN